MLATPSRFKGRPSRGTTSAMASYRAWLVDLDGTLYRSLPVKLAMGLTLLVQGRRVMPAISAFRRAHETLRHDSHDAAPAQTSSPYEQQLALAVQSSGWDAQELREAVEEWMIRRPGPWLYRARRKALIAEIEAFREGGGKCALVSDYPASHKLRAMGLRGLFDTVVCNGEARGPSKLKPDPEGYLLAAKALGIEPQACLVIGDRQDADGEAASRAGMGFRKVG